MGVDRLTERSRSELESLARSPGYDGSVGWRAQIVLWHDEGLQKKEIARLAGTSRPTVDKWLARYVARGIDGLSNIPPPGRPRVVTGQQRARILALTQMSPPESTGLTRWSCGEMAKYLRRHEGIEVSRDFVSVLWRENGLAPHRVGTFKLSRDPDFAVKVADVVGLYLDPPHGAIVLSVDEKTQIQALDRTQPLLPISFGKTEKRTHDYVRHGTTNLFAALDTGTGRVIGKCYDRRRASEFISFMDGVERQYAGQPIHVVMDNLSTHNGHEVEKWLAAHPNVTFHYTPTGSSWINQIENWFSIITKQSITRATTTSVRQLVALIDAYIEHWNEDAEPFKWTATASDIIHRVQVIHTEFTRMLDTNRNT